MKLGIVLDSSLDSKNICGIHNQNLKVLEEIFDIELDILGDSILTNTNDKIKIAKLEDIFKVLLLMSSLNQIYLQEMSSMLKV